MRKDLMSGLPGASCSKTKYCREKAQKAQEDKSPFANFAPFRGHSFWQKGRGFAEGQNVAKQPSDLWQSGLPRRSRLVRRSRSGEGGCGEGGSRSVKVNQSDFFCSKNQAIYATTLK
jgi:hypothetical protein